MTGESALSYLTIAEAAPLIEQRLLSPVELTEACIARCERVEPLLRAFITPTYDLALAAARTAAEEIARGVYRGPLHGIPVGIKDLFETAGIATTAASPLRRNTVPARDATVVRLLKEAGAVVLGKLNLHEWALGTTNINDAFPTTRNPWDRQRITGGSSGGSGAALAAGMLLGALGSDTGGSIRIPAALCGITGLKPTYGRVSLNGVIPLAWSLDHAGPMARSAADCALLLQTIAGFDEADPLSIDAPCPDYSAALENDIRDLRVGIPDAFFFETGVVDGEVLQAVRAAATVLESLGASVREVSMDELAPQDDISIFLSEAVAYHRERYEADPGAFGPSFRPRYERAAGVSGAQYAEARYRQAVAKQSLRRIFEEVDLVLTPTAVVAAGLVPEDAEEASFRELNGYPSSLLGRNTRPFNYTGAPAISLPCGFTTAGLPIGLQLTARWWAEGTLLRAAHAYQQATDWHRARPPL